jgi:GNAT superfamily N-acetyltransferase
LVLVALDGADRVAGFLVGSLDDPARTPRFGDIGYFSTFADLTGRYPAHLHVNVAQQWRSKGVGGVLVEAFVACARAGHVPGVHVVTGSASRNRLFYSRAGFRAAATTTWNGRDLVFLARDLH